MKEPEVYEVVRARRIVPSEEKMITVAEISEWPLSDFDEWFKMLDFIYLEGKLKLTKDKVQAFEQYREAAPFYDKILKIVNRPSDDKEFDMRSFFMRFNIIIRMTRQAIVKKPELVSPVTIQRIRFKAQYKWLDLLYDAEGHPNSHNLPQDEKSSLPMQVTREMLAGNPNAELAAAMSLIANVYRTIAGSITVEEIQKLKTMDKIYALKSLSYIHTNLGKYKGPMKFTQVNIGKADKDTLEKMLMDVDGESNEEE